MNIINFKDFKAKKDKELSTPENNQVMLDSQYNKFYRYALSFTHNDKDWSLDIWAENEKDALKKIKSIKKSLKLDGMILEEEDY